MKKFIINQLMNQVKKYYPQYDEDKLDELKYGFEILYINITKLSIVFIIAFLLNIFFEMLFILFIYNLIRSSAFGLHATKSWICMLSSLLIFLICPIICKTLELNYIIKIILCGFCVITYFLYAPADTYKRPLINKEKRSKMRKQTLIKSLILTFISLSLDNNFLSIGIIAGMLIESIFILPITYKIFKLPYNNYKTYIAST